MKTILKFRFLLVTLTLSLAASATASEFIYKAASPTVAAINLQKIEGGHLERFHGDTQRTGVRRDQGPEEPGLNRRRDAERQLPVDGPGRVG